ncbi:MAG: hypothetical protein ACPGUU_03050 [Flavobacteriaceae bacterium]
MRFIKWHKGVLENYKEKLGLSYYQIMWIAWFKGIIIGALLIYFYKN